MLLHMILLLILALTTLPPAALSQVTQLIVSPPGDGRLEEVEDVAQPLEQLELVKTPEPLPVAPGASTAESAVDVSQFNEPLAASSVQWGDFGLDKVPLPHELAANTLGAFSGDALAGRGAAKGLLVAQAGGTQESEQSVALALKWLAAHQMPDGGWNFRHNLAPKCRGACHDPGSAAQARVAATGLALLPFLGAGQTHKEGKYKKEVKAGLYFLVRHIHLSREGGSLWEPEGRMYGHGIASIALCEAFAMTRDKSLQAPAQQVINYICYAQDPTGGGWRYEARMPGDTSILGWQLMALKSGHMAYLQVPAAVVQKASMFLDSMQDRRYGYLYGYTSPPNVDDADSDEDRNGQRRYEATTAIGLLCRMYLGWKKDNPALKKGVEWLSSHGPSKRNMYYNYYATQVMRHWEGDLWKKWNDVMRDWLVQSQVHRGHETGSWFMEDDRHARQGGRLYCTAMATMILEVYYRHMPIYRVQSTQDSFPLD